MTSHKIHILHCVAAHDGYLLAYKLYGIDFVPHLVYHGGVRIIDIQESLLVFDHVNRWYIGGIVFQLVSLYLIPKLFLCSTL